jgi:hypothetical protein
MVTPSSVALVGDFSKERAGLDRIGPHPCAAVRPADLPKLSRDLRLLAVFIHAETAGTEWLKSLEMVRSAAPGVPAVICHGIEALDAQDDMTEAGAFYTLLLPVDEREVRTLLDRLPSEASGNLADAA